MTPTPKTIQIFLPGGDPRGIRIAEITTRIVQVIEVPRSLLANFIEMPESAHVAVYFLFGDSETGEPTVYIGQTSDPRARLMKHHKDREKGLWQRAFLLISKTSSLTLTHALFLEWYCIQATRKAKRYADSNGTGGSRPHTPAPLEADCHEIFEAGSILLATLGLPLFEPLTKPAVPGAENDMFFCTASGANGKGYLTADGFVVLAGSIARKDNVKSIVGTSYERGRVELITLGVMRPEGEAFVFTRDHLFASPSSAAIALQGRTANGWIEWKDKNGVTLHELKRAPAEEKS